MKYLGRASIIGLLAAFLTVTYASHYAVDRTPVFRHNYGIFFKPMQKFKAVTGYWLHTFGITLPSAPATMSRPRDLNCLAASPPNRTHCVRIRPFINALANIQNNMSRMLSDVIQDMTRIIPNRPPPSGRARQTRSWIPFIGRALKTVAGTATTEDLQKVNRAVEELRREQVAELNEWATTIHDVTSLTHLTNDRITKLERLVGRQRQSMVRQYYEFAGAVEDIFSMTSLYPEVTKRVVEFAGVLVHTMELRQALFDVLHGKLNTFLISEEQMKQAMTHVQAAVRGNHPALSLATKTTGEAYQLSDFIIGRKGNDVYITIKFPVTPVDQVYTLYEVRRFPVLMPDLSPHVTTLDTDISAFAYSPTAKYYIEFHTSPRVQNHFLYMPNVPETLRHDTAPTCIYALFKNMKVHIRELCSFTLQPYGFAPSVLALDEAHILFTGITDVSFRCAGLIHDRVLRIAYCPQCIHKIPCHCTLNTTEMYLPAPLTDCSEADCSVSDCSAEEFDRQHNSSRLPLTHVTNLAVLEHFFSEETLDNLAADTMLNTWVSAILPNITLFKHNYSSSLAAIEDTEFHLAKTLNLSLTRKVAFRSMAEYLDSQSVTKTARLSDDMDFGWHSVYRSPLAVGSILLSICAIGFTVMLSFKIRALSMLVMGARSAAAAPTFLNYFTSSTTVSVQPTTMTTVMPWLESYEDMMTTGLVCLFALFLLIPVYYYFVWHCVSYRRTARPYTQIFLQLITATTQVYIPFLELERYFEGYTFSAQGSLTSLNVIGSISPKLYIQWPGLIIKHEALKDTIVWPKKLKLTYAQASIIRSAILKHATPFHVLLYAHSYGDTHPNVIYFGNIKDDAQIPAEPNAPPENDNPRLYPVVM